MGVTLFVAEPQPPSADRAASVRFAVGLAALFVLTVAVALALIAAVAALLPASEVTVVGSGSMTPALRPGDVVAYRAGDWDHTGVGTIVVFDTDDGSGGTVVHRVVGVTGPDAVVTRGDANASPDSEPLTPDRLRGVGYMVVPLVGLPRVWLAEQRWLTLTAFAASLLLAALASRFAVGRDADPWRSAAPRRSPIAWIAAGPPAPPPALLDEFVLGRMTGLAQP